MYTLHHEEVLIDLNFFGFHILITIDVSQVILNLEHLKKQTKSKMYSHPTP